MNIEKLVYGTNTVQGSAEAKSSAAGRSFSGVLSSLLDASRSSLEGLFAEASKRYGVPLELLKAVAKTESNFNPLATSRCGAMGVMQLMPETAAGLGVTDAYDPEQNIMGGAKLLGRLLERYGGNTELALAAYNAGAGNVDKYGGVPPFEETQRYVSIIMSSLGGSAELSVPEKYNDYQDYLASGAEQGLEAYWQAALGGESDARETGLDPRYLVSLLQLNMQMDLFGGEEDESRII